MARNNPGEVNDSDSRAPKNGSTQPQQPQARYHRILLKLSGEALAGVNGGIDPDQAAFIAHRLKSIQKLGVQIAVVIGGGNLWRGKIGVARGMDQTTADHMGMIATVIK